MKTPESTMQLLSPAGSWESLMAAIQAGADAVYFGVEHLNMRARNTNAFCIRDLRKITGICRQHRVKSYLALNTIMFDHDIPLVKAILNSARKNHVDAVIAADHSVIKYASALGLPIHVSTQANITNIDTIGFYSAWADTMVLARELTLTQIMDLVRKIKQRKILGPSGKPVKVELFVHGAMCMAFSGKCYLSLHSHFTSANRGACAQNCRRKYVVSDKEEGNELEITNDYIMSSKDLCTIDFLDKIAGAGASVLKIEGRGRSADYVYAVTKCYREAIDALDSGGYTSEKINQWKKTLSTVFNRGFWEGYYLGRKMGEWSPGFGSQATTRKILIGKGIRYYPEKKAGEFQLESSSLSVGDQVLVTGKITGVATTTIREMRINNKGTDKAIKGDKFTILIDRIRPSDKLYKITGRP